MIPNVLAALVLLAATGPDGETDAPALRGLDPVELCRGNEVPGRAELSHRQHLYRYHFASEENRALFLGDPARYEIQLGGGCGRMGPLSGLGDPDRFAVWGGRVYVFASDSCRHGFLDDPQAHLDHDDSAPDATPATAARGAELVALAVEGLGGAERLDAVESVVYLLEERSTYEGREVLSGQRWTIRFPDRVRHETFWDDLSTVFVAAPDGGFAVRSGEVQPLHASQRALLEKEAHRLVLEALRSRGRADFRAVSRGVSEVDGVPVERVALSFAGATTVLAVDPASGRVLQSQYVGRAGIGRNGRIAIAFSDFRETGGLLLPFTQSAVWEGRPAKALSCTWTAIEVDGELPPDAFERPESR